MTLTYMPKDLRYKRNANRFRNEIQKMINDRRSGKKSGYMHEDGDLLSILIGTDFYQKNDDNLIIDEIFTFFFAGMKTVQISTTNLLYYITKHPEIKSKLLKEILPAVEEVKDNILNGLTFDRVMDFEYLQQCFYESLRIEPPVSVSSNQSFTSDVEITINNNKKVYFKKGTRFSILFEAIHHDPNQWREPSCFVPERFDTQSVWSLKPDGKPRNP